MRDLWAEHLRKRVKQAEGTRRGSRERMVRDELIRREQWMTLAELSAVTGMSRQRLNQIQHGRKCAAWKGFGAPP